MTTTAPRTPDTPKTTPSTKTTPTTPTSGAAVTPPEPAPSGSAAPETALGSGSSPGRRRLVRLRRSPRTTLPPHLRQRRRRLLLVSAPVVALLAFVALRLLTLNVVHDQTLEAYTSGDQVGTLEWGERQGWINVVEQFRAPFSIGDSYVLGGQFAQARPWFEKAFEQVPKGGIDECKVRVNLGLTYEALGDAAKARERTDEWKQFYDKGITITKERPPLCDAPEGGATGEQLDDAQQRMQQKNDGATPDDTPPPTDQGEQPPAPQPSPDVENTPSQEQQDLLQEEQKRNTVERNEQRGNDDRNLPESGSESYPKPW